MKSRTFNNYGSKLNEIWASNVLGIPLNEDDGIDLIDSSRNFGVEVKFSMDYCGWTVLDWQMNYEKKLDEAYWGLGVYKLSRPVSSIRTYDLREIERMFVSREMWIVQWDWMRQFPIHKTRGHTAKTSWALDLAYPKHRKLPKTVETKLIGSSKVHITEGVNLRNLNIAA